MGKVFASAPRNWGSILGRVIPKIQKMVLDAPLLNTPHYKVPITDKMEQSRKWSTSLTLHLSLVAILKGGAVRSRLQVRTLLF